uniref:lamin tail domain-containing protein n=1 Tax=uncultured Micrococcus sp. TaxID=114051 RepID=UPI0026019152|nr:lamin tail domain-containing protein [uncultured Micrococcus sp.]
MAPLPHGSRQLVALTAAAALVASPLAASPASAAPTLPALMITEIAPDTAGSDHFEFIEVRNTGDTAVDLSQAGLAYIYADSDDTSRDVALKVPSGTLVQPGETVVLWLSYTSSTVDSFARTEQDFRDYWATEGAGTDYRLVRVEGQPGMANGGERGVRLTLPDGTTTWSFYPAGSTSAGRTAQFRVDDDGDAGTALLEGPAVPTPGQVSSDALASPTPEPDPGEPAPVPDPSLATAPLQITEVTPDTANVDGADGYEFIEVYNATSEPVDFGDYTLDYLYPADDLTNNNVVTWPADPASFLIQPGETVVFWIKNGKNDHLTSDDFNTHFGTDLAAGAELVEIHTGGMANGSPRGLQIVTNTGFPVNTAYYNLNGADDAIADQGIQYAVDPADPNRQTLVGTAPASPGSVTTEQVPAGLMLPAADAAGPVIEDRTATEVDPAADFPIELHIADDVQVKTVTVAVRTSDMAEPVTHTLRAAEGDLYRHVINAVDLTGQRWVEYSVVASDGTHTTELETHRVPVAGVDQSGVRLSVAEGEVVSGRERITAGGDAYPSTTTVAVDGVRVEGTEAALEGRPVFAFEATSTDAFFRNGVLVGDEVLHIFDEGFYDREVTVPVDVPLEHITAGEPLTLSVYAGTKAWPEIDPDENNDDFQIRNLRLVLPDGRTLRPAGLEDGTQWIPMGDSAGKNDYVDASFHLPQDAFSATAFDWDTTTVADGEHTVTATDGTTTVTRTVTVDNTGPEISIDLADGAEVRGAHTLQATASDAGAGVDVLTAELDGTPVELPHEISSLSLPAGEHRLVLTARDLVGNTSTRTITFTTPVEQPGATTVSPADGAAVDGPDVELSATVTDPSGDALDVDFYAGREVAPGEEGLDVWTGETTVAAATERDGKVVADAAALELMGADDGREHVVSSDDAFPYQLLEVPVDDVTAEGKVRVTWDGSANPDAKVILSVLNTATGRWEELDRALTTGDNPTEFTLEGLVDVADHVRDGSVQLLVQHSEGFAHTDLSTRESAVAGGHPEDVPRSEYDFTLGWESDTQYYNETWYEHQLAIHEYFLQARERLNLAYVFHTGDIVDEWDKPEQWERADDAYRMLDEAGLPYGVLAGNHDVGHALEDYGPYGTFFGAERFDGNPWYGGSYEDNRGHDDLITVDGVDFIMLYQGWGAGDEEIAWMNEVLAQHPERTAVLNLHEYMLTTGGLGPIPQRIYDEVVATNPNVSLVFSGHYHDAFTRVDGFDDDGDGVDDRQVTQVLFDYQGLAEGGLGYLRLLHFDNEGQRMLARTYSPSLQDYNADDPSLEPQHQEFEVSYAQLGIESRTKTLGTDAVTVEVLSGKLIDQQADVASGSTVSSTWAGLTPGEYGWYIRTEDPYGAVDLSAVREFVVVSPTEPPAEVEPGPAPWHPGKGKGLKDGVPPGHRDGHPGKGKGLKDGVPPGHRDGHPGKGNGRP